MNHDEEKRTLWCGNLSEKVSQKILYSLFGQAGPLERVNIPKEKDGRQKSYGFIVYAHEESVSYAAELFKGTTLYNRTLNLQARGNCRLEKSVSAHDILARDELPSDDKATRDDSMKNRISKFSSMVMKNNDRSADYDIKSRIGLGLASLQGNWSPRNNTVDRERTNSRHEPYKKEFSGRYKRHVSDYKRNQIDDRGYNKPRNFRDHEKIDYSKNYRNKF